MIAESGTGPKVYFSLAIVLAAVARHGKLPPQRHEELPPPRIAEERVNKRERITEGSTTNDPRGQVMKTPDNVAQMMRLRARGWGVKRIARQLGYGGRG